MPQLMQPFDATQFDPAQSAGQLPIGRHKVIIESSEVKANSRNDGGYLQLNLRIIEGEFAGTTGAYRLNLYHSKPETVEIANRQFSAVCHVTGVFRVERSDQLHNIPFMVEVTPQRNEPQYTEVKKVFDVNGNEPKRGGNGGGAAQPQAQPQGNPAAGAWGAPQGASQGGWAAPQGNPAPATAPATAPAQGGQPAWGAPQGAPQGGTAPAWGAPQGGAAPQQQPQPQGQPQGGQPAWGAPGGGAPWGGGQ